MRANAVTTRAVALATPPTRRVVVIVAGTRIGLKMTKSGVTMVSPTSEAPRVIPANTKKTPDATAAITT